MSTTRRDYYAARRPDRSNGPEETVVAFWVLLRRTGGWQYGAVGQVLGARERGPLQGNGQLLR